jgi:hypothetical protein
MIGVNDGTNDCIFVTDGTALKKITSGGSATTITQAGTASTIYSLTTNGSSYFFINGTHITEVQWCYTCDAEIYTRIWYYSCHYPLCKAASYRCYW